jgi:hypothetical protein
VYPDSNCLRRFIARNQLCQWAESTATMKEIDGLFALITFGLSWYNNGDKRFFLQLLLAFPMVVVPRNRSQSMEPAEIAE